MLDPEEYQHPELLSDGGEREVGLALFVRTAGERDLEDATEQLGIWVIPMRTPDFQLNTTKRWSANLRNSHEYPLSF